MRRRNGNRRTELVLLAAVCAAVLAVVYGLGFFLPAETLEGNFLQAGQPPSLEHFFGTDSLGRDLFWRTLKGLSVSMAVGIAASLVSAGVAVLAGLAAASGSKIADAAVGWLTDLVMSVPHTVLVLLISFALGRGLLGLLAGIAATHWCSLARLVRGEVLKLRACHYVALSRRLGKSGGWILIHHLLPHLLPQLLVGMVLTFPHAILHEASISFLGYGLPPEQPAIGIILSESLRYLSAGMWWPALLPGAALVLLVLLADKLGSCLERLLAPASAQE